MDVENKPKYYGLCKNCDIAKCNNDFKKCIFTINENKKKENKKGLDKWLKK